MKLKFVTNKQSTLNAISRAEQEYYIWNTAFQWIGASYPENDIVKQYKSKKQHSVLSEETQHIIQKKSDTLFDILFRPFNIKLFCAPWATPKQQLKLLKNEVKRWNENLEFLFALPEFIKYHKDAKRNKEFVKNLWKQNKKKVLQEIDDICHTHIDFGNEVIKIVIISDKFPAGRTNREKRRIDWSGAARKDFLNYDVVYIAHELFHLIFPKGNITHAIQELICDNELRIRLNNATHLQQSNDYTFKNKTTAGHIWLEKTRELILPYWKEYLKNNTETIWQFIDKMSRIEEIMVIAKE